MRKRGPLPESPLLGKPWPRSLEQDLAHYLVDAKKKFQTNPSHPLPAFEALNQIASYVWKKNEDPPPQFVPVPWWVIELLAKGYNEYRDSAQTIAPKSLGEAYKLEGGGQGQQRKIKSELLALRDMRISHAIALALANGIKLKSVLQEQAAATGLSFAHVELIWGKYGKHYTKAVKNFPPA